MSQAALSACVGAMEDVQLRLAHLIQPELPYSSSPLPSPEPTKPQGPLIQVGQTNLDIEGPDQVCVGMGHNVD